MVVHKLIVRWRDCPRTTAQRILDQPQPRPPPPPLRTSGLPPRTLVLIFISDSSLLLMTVHKPIARRRNCPRTTARRIPDQPQPRPPPLPPTELMGPPPRTLVLIFISDSSRSLMTVTLRLHASPAAGAQPHNEFRSAQLRTPPSRS